jgi:hypothetical protein
MEVQSAMEMNQSLTELNLCAVYSQLKKYFSLT